MNRVFYIGQGSLKREYEEVLSSRGANILRFQSVNTMRFRSEESPDLIVVDRRQSREPSFRDFLRRFSGVPKIVLSDTEAFTGFSLWTKSDLAYPLSNPSAREFDFFMQKIMKEKELITDNHALKTRLANMKKEMDFFDEVSKTLTSAIEIDDILGTIMKKAKKLIRAEAWSLLLLDQETGDLVFEKAAGKKDGKDKGRKVRVKIGEGIAGWVAQEQVPVIVPDVSKDPRFRSETDETARFKARSIMCVPISNKGNILGVLEVVNRAADGPFTKDDLDLILRIVDHAAIAIERASLYQKMAELSVTDDLTKLFNTRYLNRTLDMEVTRASRHRTSLSLIFMDVDHFKLINDNYGHLVGSKLLVELGQLLLKCLRTVDIVARYGGDEFVVVLPQTAPRNAVHIAERIRKTIEHNVFLKKDGYSFKVTASFGVASYPESAKSKEELLKLADEAMYRVKYQTRNGVYAIV